jgi:hypothetical protein
MNQILLIGNGFDLAHGLKTSYNNFIDDFWEQRTEIFLEEYNKHKTPTVYGTYHIYTPEYKDDYICIDSIPNKGKNFLNTFPEKKGFERINSVLLSLSNNKNNLFQITNYFLNKLQINPYIIGWI